jgi:hypothetical protein
MANTKKKTKTTRITKTDRLRMAAEKTRPTGITVAVGRQYEVEIVPMYDPFTHKRDRHGRVTAMMIDFDPPSQDDDE